MLIVFIVFILHQCTPAVVVLNYEFHKFNEFWHLRSTFSNKWYNAEQLKQQTFNIENKKYNKYNKLIINKLYLLYLLSSFL